MNKLHFLFLFALVRPIVPDDSNIFPPMDAPPSIFQVGSTETNCPLSSKQRQSLNDNDFTKIVCPFGVVAVAIDSYPDTYLIHVANTIAKLLDMDEDGIIDDPTVFSLLQVTINSPPILTGGVDSETEDSLGGDSGFKTTFGLQSYKAKFDEGSEEVKRISVEEIFHMFHQMGYARAYPTAFGVNDFETSIVCREMAKLTCCDPGWHHPENSCPSNGQCGNEISLPLSGSCNEASCDCVEFYHQVALTLANAQAGWYASEMPENSSEMRDMLSTEFLDMFDDSQYHQINSASDVNGLYEPSSSTNAIEPFNEEGNELFFDDDFCKGSNTLSVYDMFLKYL